VEEQLAREPKAFPTVRFNHDFDSLESFKPEYVELVGYEPHATIKAELTISGGYNKDLHGIQSLIWFRRLPFFTNSFSILWITNI